MIDYLHEKDEDVGQKWFHHVKRRENIQRNLKGQNR